MRKSCFLILMTAVCSYAFAQQADSTLFKSATYKEILEKMEEARFRAAQDGKLVQDGNGQQIVYVLPPDEMKRLEKKYLKSYMEYYGIKVKTDETLVPKKQNSKTEKKTAATTTHSGPGIALDENLEVISNTAVAESKQADTSSTSVSELHYYTDAFGETIVQSEEEFLKDWKGFSFKYTTNLMTAKRNGTAVDVTAELDDAANYIEITLERRDENEDDYSQVQLLKAPDILPLVSGNTLKLTDKYPLSYQQQVYYRITGLTDFGAIVIYPPVKL